MDVIGYAVCSFKALEGEWDVKSVCFYIDVLKIMCFCLQNNNFNLSHSGFNEPGKKICKTLICDQLDHCLFFILLSYS